jgi:dihydroorotate dehydrogenase
MGWLYEKVFKRMAFALDPEVAHDGAVLALSILSRIPPACGVLEWWHGLPRSLRGPVECFGVRFPNRVGMAAGFDKNAECWRAGAAMGFGHVEIGTITRHAQDGNPKPRLVRFPAHEALLNRMGFNNDGAERVARRLAAHLVRGHRRIPLGINIGKSRVTPIAEAVEDFVFSFKALAGHADFMVVNVSSPNTPGLRTLQEARPLAELLGALQAENRAREAPGAGGRRPLLLKIAPDLTYPQIDAVLGIVAAHRLDGIIATNTTIERPGALAGVTEAGGISGAPLARKSTEIIRYISRATEGRLPIIGVGGIHSASDAGEKIDAGASLVQIYSGWVFRGPFFPAEIAWALARR